MRGQPSAVSSPHPTLLLEMNPVNPTRRTAGIAAALALTLGLVTAQPASAGQGTASCLLAIGEPTPIDIDITVEGSVDPGPYAPGEAVTLRDLRISVVDGGGGVVNGRVTILGQELNLGDWPGDESTGESTFGPADVEITAPEAAGPHDVVPTGLVMTVLFLPVTCELSGDLSLGSIEVEAQEEEEEESPPTTTAPPVDSEDPPRDATPASPAPGASPVRAAPAYTG